jgi:CspA family cold shock protein
MKFADRWATDEAGNRFLFTVEMQRDLTEAGLPLEPESLAQLAGKPQVRAVTPPVGEDDDLPAGESLLFADDEEDYDDEGGADEADLQPTTVQIDPETGKYIGRLKWYNPSRGYGFIARGAGEDIFFHRSDFIGDPENMAEGAWLLYDVEETQKGLEASEIEPYQGDPSNLY